MPFLRVFLSLLSLLLSLLLHPKLLRSRCHGSSNNGIESKTDAASAGHV
jgi:hypothetical protein